MTTPTIDHPQAGWRRDPAGLAAFRWHDGMMWTTRTRNDDPTSRPTSAAGPALAGPASDGTESLNAVTGLTHTGPACAAAAGWYDDPAGSGMLRLFDGVTWTDQFAVREPTAVSGTRSAATTSTTTTSTTVSVPRQRAPEGLERRWPAWLSVRNTGTAMMTVALVVLAYFMWNLYLADIVTDWQQRHLREQMAASAPLVTPTPLVPNASGSPVAQGPSAPPSPATVPHLPANGLPVGTLSIPTIGVHQVFVAGTGVEDLKKGPGVWRDGVFPGTPGNATISGHRTTYGGPFRHIDQLKIGDRIVVSVAGQPDAVFEVRGSTIVTPSQISVTFQTPGVRLTLTTCDPVGRDAKRLVVQAELVEGTWAGKALPASEWKLQR